MFNRLRRLFQTVGREAATLWHACRHPGTPRSIKVAAILLVLYVLSPIDLIPDWIPVLGWLDDVGVLALGLRLLLRQIPATVLADLPVARGRAGS